MQYKAKNRRRQRADPARIFDRTKHTREDVAMIRDRPPKS
jgi:hypothetical protein